MQDFSDFVSNIAQPEAARPSAEFLDTAQQVALAVGADIDSVIRGEAFTHDGLAFSLHQHGPIDPTGMVAAIHMGSKGVGLDEQACKSLLKHHFAMPAGICGYFAIHPQSEELLYCIRMDLQKLEKPAETIRMLIDVSAPLKKQWAELLGQEIDKVLASRQANAPQTENKIGRKEA